MAEQGAELASQRRPALGGAVGVTGLAVAVLGLGGLLLGSQLPPDSGAGVRELLVVLGLLAAVVGLATVISALVTGGWARYTRARLRSHGIDVSGVVTQITPTVSGRRVSLEYRFRDQRGRTRVGRASTLPTAAVRGGRLVVGDEVRVRFHERDPELSDVVLPGALVQPRTSRGRRA